MGYPAVPYRSLPGVLKGAAGVQIECGVTVSIVERNIDASIWNGEIEAVIAIPHVAAAVVSDRIAAGVFLRDVDAEAR